MANDFSRSLKIYLDASAASKSIKQLTESIENHRQSLAKLNETGKGNTKEAKAHITAIEKGEKALKKYNDTIEQTKSVMNNLSGATYNELKNATRQMTADIKQMAADTDEYKASLEQLHLAKERLSQLDRELNGQSQTQATLWQRLSSSLNKYFLSISTSISGVMLLISGVRKAVEAYMEVDEAMAKIRKYAGLTDEEVRKFSKSLGDLGNIDTRTSHMQLLELAADAGRLGIKGTENLENFTRAADKIKLALGEDLGDDAVTNIGKIANLMGEDQRLGLETAMLSTASAVTKLAKSSTACEPYLVDFTARMGGIGAVADITTPQILGIGSALDQNMQQVETSSTVISALVTKLFQDTAKFARLAGKDVNEFSRLLKTDANEALLQFLEAMRERGGFDEIASMFGEMSMQGKRSVQVLSTLAAHVDQVREAQAIATEAYRENVEVEHEFQVMNNTSQALLDKRKKQLQQIRVELGEKLMPIMVHVKSTQNILLHTLKFLIESFSKWGFTIAASVIAIASYTTKIKAADLWTKLITNNVKRLKDAFNAMTAAVKANPWMALAAALVAVINVVVRFVKHNNELVASLDSVEKAQRRASSATEAEGRRMNTLLEMIGDTNSSEDTRRQAMLQLININPEFLGCLDAQKSGYEDAKAAVAEYMEHLQLQAEMEELIQSKQNLNDQLNQHQEKQSTWWNRHVNAMRQTRSYVSSTGGTVTTVHRTTKADEYEAQLKQNIADVEARMDEVQRKIEAMINRASVRLAKQNVSSPGAPISSDELKELYEGSGGYIEQLNDEYDKIQHDLEMALARREIAEDEFAVRNNKNESERQAALIALYEHYSSALDNATFDKEEKREKARDSVAKKRQTAEEKLEESLIKMETSFYDAREGLMKQTDKAETDQTAKLANEYEKRRKAAFDCYNAIAAYIALNVSDANTANSLMLQAQQSYYSTLQQLSEWYNYKRAEQDLKAQREHIAMLKKYGTDTTADEYQVALMELDLYYQARLLSDEEYQRARQNLEDEYLFSSAQNHERILSQFITQSLVSKYQLDLQQLNQYHKKGMLSEEEYQRSLLSLKYKYAREYASQFMQMNANMVQAMQDAEIAAVESKYEVLIRAAENNGEDTSQLEQDAANEKLKIQKKYAMSNLVVKLSQITADTAVAIMTGFAQLGPVAGAVAAVMLGLTGAAQYAAAFAEYNKISRISLQSTPQGSSQQTPTPQRVVQYASGRYDVIGIDDGRHYNVPFIGSAETGIVTRPALVAEHGSELIVSADTLERLRSHINYPLVVNAINDSRSGRVSQHASGNYEQLPDPKRTTSAASDVQILEALLSIYSELKTMPRTVKANVLLQDIDDARDLQRRSSAPFTRGDKH